MAEPDDRERLMKLLLDIRNESHCKPLPSEQGPDRELSIETIRRKMAFIHAAVNNAIVLFAKEFTNG